jgi:hypothetical protein
MHYTPPFPKLPTFEGNELVLLKTRAESEPLPFFPPPDGWLPTNPIFAFAPPPPPPPFIDSEVLVSNGLGDRLNGGVNGVAGVGASYGTARLSTGADRG